jgi:lysophospholipase L1-like esterase
MCLPLGFLRLNPPIGDPLLFHKRRPPRALAVVVGIALSSLSVSLVGFGGTGVAGAATTPSVFYLDIGGSASVGVQPTVSNPHGEPTASGYANDLVVLEAAKGVSLQMIQTGCPGESTTTMLFGSDHCYESPATQLTTAVSFLQSHHDQTGIVTVDLGFNNVVKCIKMTTGVSACLNQGFATVRQELPKILTTLQAAAGPNVHFVGVGHYDPFLASALHGTTGIAKATRSLDAMTTLNRTLSHIYQSFLIPTADVARAFKNFDHTPTTLPGVGTVATNIAETCSLTWMCQLAPYGPNLHPNDGGYEIIASAIAAKLPTTF